MAVETPNVLPIQVAAERYGLSYTALRELVRAGAITRFVFDESAKQPPLFVFVAEMEAWKRGGLDAVRRVQEKSRAKTGA